MTDPAPVRLTDGDEVLLRQVHPTWMDEGEVLRTAFTPTTTDKKQLSTLREYVGAPEAYRRWTEDKGNASVGTYGVSVEEAESCSYVRHADGQTVGLLAWDDAAARREPDHASIDTREVSKEQRTQAARKMREHASSRGCLYAP